MKRVTERSFGSQHIIEPANERAGALEVVDDDVIDRQTLQHEAGLRRIDRAACPVKIVRCVD
jgi:hypothetical protein